MRDVGEDDPGKMLPTECVTSPRRNKLDALQCTVAALGAFYPRRTVSDAGGLAHWLEPLNGNRIYRPEQEYVGKANAPYTPLEKRP